MSGVVKSVKNTFLGGAEKDAAKQQQKALEQAQTFTREGIAQARGDILKLFPQAQEASRMGFQGALDVFGQTIPQQAQAFQGGNVAAQQALLAGLPQQQAAILGQQAALQPLNVQPFSFQPDFSFAQQQLPDFTPTPLPDLLSPPEDKKIPFDFLSGGFGGLSEFLRNNAANKEKPKTINGGFRWAIERAKSEVLAEKARNDAANRNQL